MKRTRIVLVLLTTVITCGAAAGCGLFRGGSVFRPGAEGPAQPDVRRTLFQDLTPITLSNCTLQRYGAPNDGGYLMCKNLMGDAQAAYSYGIDARDDWGCDVSRQIQKPVQEYDCFNLKRPLCNGGVLQFHEECIAEAKATIDGRLYDSLPGQLAANSDAGKRLIVKMDVEGAEWESLLATPDAVIDLIDQLVIELHHTNKARYVEAVEKLRRHFYVAHVHSNNYACQGDLEPFTAWANEVLFVNKRIGTLDLSGGTPRLPTPLDALNNPLKRDCQPTF